MKLSEKIILLRKQEHMSQEELAERLSVSRQAISRWENDSAKPDAEHILEISRLFGVTTDYLLNDSYESDNDIPKVKEQNDILHTNLTLIAIIMQASFLSVAMKPFVSSSQMTQTEVIIKIIPLLLCSIWMAHNLRYEKNYAQYKKNTRIEMCYCMVQAVLMLYGYYSGKYVLASILLFTVLMIYILYVNPKYMHRQFTRKRKMKG